MKFLQLIGDYGTGDPAFAEIVQKFMALDSSLTINTVSVPKFSTLATGFWIGQLATVNPFKDLVIFANTAPRIKMAADVEKTYKGMYGHLAYAELDNGVPVIAVHVGYAFSFIKSHIKKFHLINVPNVGSQFRSRDFYPDGTVGVLHNPEKFLGEAIPLESIPDVPKNRIGFIDGYGNIKTTTRFSEFQSIPAGTKIGITLNGMTKTAVVGNETFDVADGELCFAAGSSGGDDRVMEIWVKGESAWGAFGKPHVEAEFSISVLS